MRRSFLSIASAFTAIVLKAQWCVPTTAVPYSTDMPGITQFTCNTIDRTSADIENFPYNSYVNTGLSTVLEKGITYPVTIGCTIDAVNFPGSHMSLRVWVDFNHDGQLDDVGETLLSTDHAPGPAFNGNISIPTDAMTGPTRLRVTAKMCNHTGHSAPTPCDMPADPIGYHGELEDYTVDIIEAVGVEELEPSSSLHIVGTATATTFRFRIDASCCGACGNTGCDRSHH